MDAVGESGHREAAILQVRPPVVAGELKDPSCRWFTGVLYSLKLLETLRSRSESS